MDEEFIKYIKLKAVPPTPGAATANVGGGYGCDWTEIMMYNEVIIQEQ